MQKGGVVQDTFEKLGKLAKDSAKAVGSEPGKVLENVLSGDDSSGEEQGNAGKGKQAKKKTQADPLLVKKKEEDRERVQKLLSLHRQRLKEEEAYQERTITKEEQEEEIKEREKDEEEQIEIVQLRKQDAKDAVLNAPTAASAKGPQGPLSTAKKNKGTKELGRPKD